MRSVIIFMADVTMDMLATCLSQHYPKQILSQHYPEETLQWIDRVQEDPVLYINIMEFKKWENLDKGLPPDEEELQEAQELATRLGKKPTFVVSVNISGRHPGDKEVRTCITNLLSQFRGVVQDEYTSHFWSLTEIQTDLLVEGHSFFDYQGWYDEFQSQRLEREIKLAEAQEKIQKQFGDAMDDETLCKMIAAGRKKDAVLRLRRRTGWVLQEALSYLNQLEEVRRQDITKWQRER